MNYGIVKLRKDGLITYNLDIFDEGEEVIALPLEDFQTEMLRLKYFLEKSGDKAQDIIKGRVRYKKQGINKIGDELLRAKKTIDALTHFGVQTSLNDFDWPELKVRKKKRLADNRSRIQAIVGVGEVLK